jgi:Na+-driven multidrug efflux pump
MAEVEKKMKVGVAWVILALLLVAASSVIFNIFQSASTGVLNVATLFWNIVFLVILVLAIGWYATSSYYKKAVRGG